MINLSLKDIEKQNLDFAQNGLKVTPYSDKNWAQTAFEDLQKMDCKEYRLAYPIQLHELSKPISFLYESGFEGEFFDVAEFIQGKPEHWYKSAEPARKTVKIQVDFGIAHVYTSGEAAEWLNKIVNLYYSLVKLYNVELTVVYSCLEAKDSQTDIVIPVQVVGCGEYLNEAKAIYMFSPLFYRLAVFAQFRKMGASASIYRSNRNRLSSKLGPRKEGDKFIIPGLYNKAEDKPETDFYQILAEIRRSF